MLRSVATARLEARTTREPVRTGPAPGARRYHADHGRARVDRGTSGNVSARLGEGMLVTPSGVTPDRLAPETMVAVDATGATRPGAAKPSSEWRMHLGLYARRPDVQAVVHCHSRHATILACAGRAIPAMHYMVAVGGKASHPACALRHLRRRRPGPGRRPGAGRRPCLPDGQSRPDRRRRQPGARPGHRRGGGGAGRRSTGERWPSAAPTCSTPARWTRCSPSSGITARDGIRHEVRSPPFRSTGSR